MGNQQPSFLIYIHNISVKRFNDYSMIKNTDQMRLGLEVRNTLQGDDIVCSAWKHAAGFSSGTCVANMSEQKGCELNSRLWNSTTDDNSPARKQARAQKRRLQYIGNILIVDDPKHPENNGTVRLFEFGKTIFDKIMDKARPTFDDEEPVNVFDYWEGANFKLRMRQVDGYPNYDASVFADPAPIAKSDEAILEIANQQYLLKEFLDTSNFKSYETAKKKLETVLAAGEAPMTAMDAMESKTAPSIKSKPAIADEEDDDGDMLSYFQALANED